MAYAIMRAKKLNSMGSVASSLQHCYRERETHNADTERTPENDHMAAKSTDEAMGRLRELLPEKRRKDAVLAVEYVMTASPEWWETATPQQQDAFFSNSLRWLGEKYGEDRVITATVHRDETSPHLSAFVVPLTQDGRLSAKEFIGNRQKMRNDQTTFAESVEYLGLNRGIEGSQSRHQSIQKHYAAINKGEKERAQIRPQMLEPQRLEAKGLTEKIGLTRRMETPEMIAERLTSAVNEYFSGTVSIAAESAQNARRAREAEKTAKDMRDRLKPLIDAIQPLNQQERAQVVGVFQQMTKNLQENKQKQQEQAREQRRNLQTEKSRDRNRGGGGLER